MHALESRKVESQGAQPAEPLLKIRGLQKRFPVLGGLLQRPVAWVNAVDDLSLDIQRGEVLGLVGESGSGKTTAGRSILRLLEPTAGSIRFDGQEIVGLPAGAMRAQRRRMQIVFQDPYASLDPRQRVRDVIGEALVIHGIGRPADRRDRVAALLEKVGLTADAMDRFPHEFSGGQRQRIGIARALAVEPDFIVADEPVSALDVSVQAQVVNLLRDLQRELGLAVLFIAHDLAVVRYISDRVAVMYLGRIVEIAEGRKLFENPRMPYTKMLLGAVPDLAMSGRQRIPVKGEIPNPIDPPRGCAFNPRCPLAFDLCREKAPELIDGVACHAVNSPAAAVPA